MAHYEIEIKSLLGEASAAAALIAAMQANDPNCAKVTESQQLNHYFTGGDVSALYAVAEHLFSGEQCAKFKKLVEQGSDFSVRTRKQDDTVLLVVKASLDGGTSANTVSRLEFEEAVALTLEELDALVLKAGYQYQAKWSRDREEYAFQGLNVCIDRNAGYGYLAEFEKVVHDSTEAAAARIEIEAVMAALGVAELSQERLARMFDHYNQNWAAYYGTDKTFTIS